MESFSLVSKSRHVICFPESLRQLLLPPEDLLCARYPFSMFMFCVCLYMCAIYGLHVFVCVCVYSLQPGSLTNLRLESPHEPPCICLPQLCCYRHEHIHAFASLFYMGSGLPRICSASSLTPVSHILSPYSYLFIFFIVHDHVYGSQMSTSGTVLQNAAHLAF